MMPPKQNVAIQQMTDGGGGLGVPLTPPLLLTFCP